LVLFSDGVTEAGVETEEEFGEDGLLSVIQSLAGSSADALVAGVINAVAGEKQDDVTVVAVRVL
jgi:serine phosphatase RsbU (regulator of sigma subunit)